MSDTPHYAMIQVDLDGLDSVLDCYGSALGEQETDTVYADGVVRLLDLLKEFDLKATFFLIGRDAEIPYKRRVLERLVREGHELGNHTYSHPLGFARLSMEEQRSEIERCSTLIRELSGREPVGFRAPGYAITGQVVNFLEELRFSYDASVFPCACSFLIRAWQSLFSPSQFEEEKYGASIHAVAPQSPYLPDREKVYRVSSEEREICEVPVSTTRLFRLPFHGSYVMVFSKLVKNLGLWYWRVRLVPPQRDSLRLRDPPAGIDRHRQRQEAQGPDRLRHPGAGETLPVPFHLLDIEKEEPAGHHGRLRRKSPPRGGI